MAGTLGRAKTSSDRRMCALRALVEVVGLRSCVHARDANARAVRDYRVARGAYGTRLHTLRLDGTRDSL